MKEKVGVIFEKDMDQELNGVNLVIKSGKVYPLTKESTEGMLLSQKDHTSNEFVRVYVALVENDMEIVLYDKENGNGFKLI